MISETRQVLPIEFSVVLSTTEIDQILSNRDHPLRLELINLLLQGSSPNHHAREKLWRADSANVVMNEGGHILRGQKKHRGKHRSHNKGAYLKHFMAEPRKQRKG